MMAVRKPASLLLMAFAIATLAYFSCQTSAVRHSPLGPRGRMRAGTYRVQILSKSGSKHFVESLDDLSSPRVSENLQVGGDSDYGPPSVNPPIHVDPPITPITFDSHQLDTNPNIHEDYAPATGHPPIDYHDYPPPHDFVSNHQLDTNPNIHEDYAPGTSHPPIDYHDYPPPHDFVPRKTWSSEASFMHATLPAPTMIYHPENLSGP